MTMQVAMKGKDGIILASDTRSTEEPALRDNEFWNGGRLGPNVHKIKIDHEKGIAISGAWDMKSAGYIARKIISDLTIEMSNAGGIEDAIQGIALDIPATYRRRVQCLVVLTRPTLQIIWLQGIVQGGEWKVDCRKFLDLMIAGDNTNAAIFWAERYYLQNHWIKKPMKRLVPLAAHMICSAHFMNSFGIDGLEMVLCSSSGIQRLSDKSIETLKNKADEWDKEIENRILAHNQGYKYAPKTDG